MIERHKATVTTTGSAGSATGNVIIALPMCELVAVYLDFHASAPATTDTTITAPGGDPADVTVLTVSNSATDAWKYPKVQDHDNTGAAITGAYSDPVIPQNLLVALAQCDALTAALTIYVYVRT